MQLLRSGRATEARELCEKYGQCWRAAALFVNSHWQDGVAVTAGFQRDGNPFQLLWRWMCWQNAALLPCDQVSYGSPFYPQCSSVFIGSRGVLRVVRACGWVSSGSVSSATRERHYYD